MKGFNGYKRIAVICLPNEEELKQRLAAQKEKEFVYAVKEWTMNHIQGMQRTLLNFNEEIPVYLYSLAARLLL